MAPHSIYLHIPFCQHRCGYCDFNTYAGMQELIPAYSRALIEEIRFLSRFVESPILAKTIFFGGGTPTLLPEQTFEQILRALDDAFQFDNQLEITVEANPGTITLEYLKSLKNLGINRLSLGMQSAHARELRFLERKHDYGDVVAAVKWARQAGFDNLSLDLIFGLPEQQIDLWRDSLNLALGLRPEHFSLYALTVEHGTPLGKWTDRGLTPIPDPDIAADMYELACDSLAKGGYVQYEISNWSLASQVAHPTSPSFACQHNLQYWRNQPYIGLGAGAHGFVNGYRTQNLLSPRAYIKRITPAQLPSKPYPQTPATTQIIKIDQDTEMRETMMMGLRLTAEGVSDDRFQARFGLSIKEVFDGELEELVTWGLIEWAGETIRLTHKGKLLGNQVFMRFV